MKQRFVEGTRAEFMVIDDVLRFHNRVCVPINDDLSHKILTKAYNSFYTIYRKIVKIYKDLRMSF